MSLCALKHLCNMHRTWLPLLSSTRAPVTACLLRSIHTSSMKVTRYSCLVMNTYSGVWAMGSRPYCTGVRLTASPQVCMHDVHTSLHVTGLRPDAAVTIRAETLNESGKKFCTHAFYFANANGEVKPDKDPSVGGNYEGVFPAGLLTTLAPAPGEFPFLRLYRRDPGLPWQIDITVHDGHHPVTADRPGAEMASVRLTRLLMAPGVRRSKVREGRVRGVLYLPPAGHGPFVGIVDMFGAVGGIMEFRAAMLASRGYAVLSLPFFSYEDLPVSPDKLEIEYFEEAIKFVLAQEEVIPDRCGMISVSKSTLIGLLTSTKVPELAALVCIGIVLNSFDTEILYKGKVIFPSTSLQFKDITIDSEGRAKPNIESPFFKVTDNLCIPLEDASSFCHYLIAVGSEDTWNCPVFAKVLKTYADKRQMGDKMDCVHYEGAGHIIEPPYGPLLIQSYQRVTLPEQYAHLLDDAQKSIGADMPGGFNANGSVIGFPILFGGQAKETCHAQVDLWQRMQTFFDRKIKASSPWYQNYLLENVIPSSKL